MNIYVGNIPRGVNEEQLKALFEGFGEVTSVKIITDRETGQPRGFAFVDMSDDEQAQTGSLLLGSEKRLKNSLAIFLREAQPLIDKFDLQVTPLNE